MVKNVPSVRDKTIKKKIFFSSLLKCFGRFAPFSPFAPFDHCADIDPYVYHKIYNSAGYFEMTLEHGIG